MAIVYSDLITNRDASPPVMSDQNMYNAGLHVAYATYTVVAGTTLATADVIQMIPVPKGAILWPHLCKITWTAFGSTCTFDIGDGVDPNRYTGVALDGTATSSTLATTFVTAMDVNVAKYEYTANDTIDITLVTFATQTDGAIIQMTAVYSMNG